MLVRRTFGIPVSRLFGAALAPLAIALPLAAACGWISVRFPPRTWLTLALAMASAALAYLALAWFTLLSERQKSLWISRIRLALTV